MGAFNSSGSRCPYLITSQFRSVACDARSNVSFAYEIASGCSVQSKWKGET